MTQKKKFIIIDAHALIHRAYHALPPLATKKGEIVNAVYGFLLVFLKVLKELKPDYIAAAFDMPEPTFRHEEFEEYKAKRPKAPDELYNQIPRIKEALKAFNVPIYEKAGFEADDIIGFVNKAISKKQAFPEPEIIIVSGDLDTLQLVGKHTKVYTLRKGMQDTVIYGEKEVKDRYELKPEQLPDFKGLKGDPSDNIPGVPGVGEKTAIELIKKYGSLEDLYKSLEKSSFEKDFKKYSGRVKDNLLAFKDQAFFSKMLATIREDVPIKFRLDDCKFKSYNKEAIKNLLKELEFYSLIGRLPEEDSSEGRLDSDQEPEKEVEPPISKRIEEFLREGLFSKQIYDLEKSLIPVIDEMQKNGVKIDTGRLKNISKKLEEKIEKVAEKIYKLAGGPFNINSPQQLSLILFEKLGIPIKGLKKTPGGVTSTSFPELEKIRGEHPIIKLIQEYRTLAKLKTGFVDSLSLLVNAKDGRIHPHFNQLGAVTGRMSCQDPNLQNIPIRGGWGREIRKAFVAVRDFGLVSFDYSQMELRVAAHIAKDKKMIEGFKRGEDIHILTAAEVNNISREKVTRELRSQAKSLNFGLLYGMSIQGFARDAGIEFSQAKKFIQEYMDDFQGIASYTKKTKEKVRKDGYVETIFGRKRFIPEINSRDGNLRLAAERMAINMPVQGSAADIMKMAMVEIYRFLSEEKKDKIYKSIGLTTCKLILQIHDELLFEIKNDIIKDVVPQIKNIMESVYKLQVPLEVNIKVGQTWGDMVEYK